MIDTMKDKHLGKAIVSGIGGAMMGAFLGCVPYWLLGAAGMFSAGAILPALLIVGVPALIMAYREGKHTYDTSRQNARDPMQPAQAEEKTPVAASLSQGVEPEITSPKSRFVDAYLAQKNQSATMHTNLKNSYSRA